MGEALWRWKSIWPEAGFMEEEAALEVGLKEITHTLENSSVAQTRDKALSKTIVNAKIYYIKPVDLQITYTTCSEVSWPLFSFHPGLHNLCSCQIIRSYLSHCSTSDCNTLQRILHSCQSGRVGPWSESFTRTAWRINSPDRFSSFLSAPCSGNKMT